MNGTLSECLPCSPLCESCDTADQCLTCKDPKNREIDPFTRECKCRSGFKETKDGLSSECVKCYFYKH